MTAALPLSIFDGHALVVGTTGSGKSYLVRGIAERLRADGRRIAIVDKLGTFWGLTVAADGKGPGFEFVLFGGRRPGAVPMAPGDGARLGALLVERQFPAIFDLSSWDADDQDIWVDGFASAVFEANETALHLVVDEAQSFVPQGGGRNRETGTNAFGQVRRIAEQGRGRGIHLLLAVQRLSRIDKTVASMANAIVAMRQTGTTDRRQVRDLIGGQADEGGKLFDELPTLETGEGWVWNPVAGQLARRHFPANQTFDSSRTPRHGDAAVAPIAVSGALVDELRALLAPPAPAPHPDDVIPTDPGEAYGRGSAVGDMLAERDARNVALAAERDAARLSAELAEGTAAALLEAIEKVKAILAEVADLPVQPGVGLDIVDDEAPAPAPPAKPPAATPDLPPRRLKILEAISWAECYLDRAAIPRSIVGWLAEASPVSSTFERDLGAMRTAGLVAYPEPGTLALTAAGIRAAPPIQAKPGLAHLRAEIFNRLPPRQRGIVRALLDGATRSREEIAAAAGTSSASSTFERDCGRLRTLGLLEYPAPGRLRAAALLLERKR